MKTTSEVISCTIASLRTRADQYDQDARLATHQAEQHTRSAAILTAQASALRQAADRIEHAILATTS